MGKIVPLETDNTASDILEAATARFKQYGYRKTTMAEIAHDCGMSAGNLYRYFDNKADIGAAVCVAWFAAVQSALNETVRSQPSAHHLPAPEPAASIERYIRTLMELTLQSCRETPHIQDMIDFLSEERRDILRDHLRACRDIIAFIIQKGVDDGSITVPDVDEAASAVQFALVRFEYPPLLMFSPPEDLEKDIAPMVRLIVDGLRTGN